MPQDKISPEQLIQLRGFRKDMIAGDLNITPSALSHKLKRRRRLERKRERTVLRDSGGASANGSMVKRFGADAVIRPWHDADKQKKSN